LKKKKGKHGKSDSLQPAPASVEQSGPLHRKGGVEARHSKRCQKVPWGEETTSKRNGLEKDSSSAGKDETSKRESLQEKKRSSESLWEYDVRLKKREKKNKATSPRNRRARNHRCVEKPSVMNQEEEKVRSKNMTPRKFWGNREPPV